jgi:hypothetical protein
MADDELTPEEHEAVIRLLRKAIDEDRYPLSDRVGTWKAALAKLDPASAPKPRPAPLPLPEAPMRSRGGRRTRR